MALLTDREGTISQLSSGASGSYSLYIVKGPFLSFERERKAKAPWLGTAGHELASFPGVLIHSTRFYIIAEMA